MKKSRGSNIPVLLSAIATVVMIGIVAIAASAQAPAPRLLPYTARTVAGQYQTPTNEPSVPLGDNGLATSATLNSPRGVAVDSLGNIYIADTGLPNNTRIRKIDAGTGKITTVVGGGASSVTDGAPALSVALNQPRGIEVDANGTLWIAESSGNKILKVGLDGNIKIVARSSKGGYGGDGTLPTTPSVSIFYNPETARVDQQGNLYLADVGNCIVRKITNPGESSAVITTVFGHTPAVGTGTKCSAYATWNISTADGMPCVGSTAPYMGQIYDVAVDNDGNIYVADNTAYRVRECFANIPKNGTKAGKAYTIAGTGSGCNTNGCPTTGNVTFSGFGPSDATATDIGKPVGLKLDAAGNLYISDSSNNVVWFLDAATKKIRVVAGYDGTIRTAACSYKTNIQGDGCPGPWAKIGGAQRIALDPAGNLYVAEQSNHLIRVFASGVQATAPGQPVVVKNTVGNPAVDALQIYYAPGDGPAVENAFVAGGNFALNPGCAKDPDGNATPSDTCVVNLTFATPAPGRLSGSLKATTLNGATTVFGITGVAAAASAVVDPGQDSLFDAGTLHNPQGIVLDGFGNTYVVDYGANAILKNGQVFVSGLSAPKAMALDAAGNIYVANSGTGKLLGVDAISAAVTELLTGLSNPSGVAVDIFGNVFVSDTGNNKIWRIDAWTRQASVLLGGGSSVCTGAACPPTDVALNAPRGLFVDDAQKLYVADTGNRLIGKLDLAANRYSNVGGAASMQAPVAVATDPAGNIYVVDEISHIATVINPGSDTASTLLGVASTPGSTGTGGRTLLNAPTGIAVDNLGNVFVADSKNDRIVKLNRLVNSSKSLNFGVSVVDFASEPLELTVWNIGNVDLNFLPRTDAVSNACLTDTAPHFSLDFCNPLAVGAKRALPVTFTPTAVAQYVETAGFLSDGIGNPVLTMSGEGKNLPATTTTVTASPAVLNYGDTVTLTATVAPATETGVPAGQVTCSAGGVSNTSDLVDGVASVSLAQVPPGSEQDSYHVVASCKYLGDTMLWASSTGTATITVNRGSSTTTLKLTLDSADGTAVTGSVQEFDNKICVTATVNSSVTGPNNNSSVQFFDNGQPLGLMCAAGRPDATHPDAPCVQPVMNGRATYCSGLTPEAKYEQNEPPAFLAGTHSLTAKFLGDSNLAVSVSAASVLNVTAAAKDFTMTFAKDTLVVSGQAGTTISVVPQRFPKATITFKCSNLPAYTSCTFVPNSIHFTDKVTDVSQTRYDNPVLIGFTVTSDTAGTASLMPHRGFGDIMTALALMCPGLVLGGVFLGGTRRRKSLRGKLLFLVAVTVMGGMIASGLIGCGSSAPTVLKATSPRGTTTIQVTATLSDGADASHTVSYPITIQ